MTGALHFSCIPCVGVAVFSFAAALPTIFQKFHTRIEAMPFLYAVPSRLSPRNNSGYSRVLHTLKLTSPQMPSCPFPVSHPFLGSFHAGSFSSWSACAGWVQAFFTWTLTGLWWSLSRVCYQSISLYFLMHVFFLCPNIVSLQRIPSTVLCMKRREQKNILGFFFGYPIFMVFLCFLDTENAFEICGLDYIPCWRKFLFCFFWPFFFFWLTIFILLRELASSEIFGFFFSKERYSPQN